MKHESLCVFFWGAASFSIHAFGQEDLKEVIVTAQLREQSLEKVPIAMSVFDSEALVQRDMRDIKDIARSAPELEVQSNTEAVRVSYRIRRVGNLGNIPTFEPEVAVFVDEAFRSRTFYGAADLIDTERVEILRGPQLTLYGKNAAAGVIGFYSKKPQEEFNVRTELTLGAIEGATTAPLYRFKGFVEGALTDTLNGSFALGYRGHGHTDESVLSSYSASLNNQNSLAMRAQLAGQIGDTDLRLLLGHGRENDDRQDGDLYYDPSGWVANVVLPAFKSAGISTGCASNNYSDRKTCVRNAMHNRLNDWEATLLVNQTLFERWKFSSITSWDWFRFEGRWDDAPQVGAPLLRFHDTQRANSLQQQFRLASTAGEKLDWILGGMVYRNRFYYGDADRPLFLWDAESANPSVVVINQALLGAPLPFATHGQEGVFRSYQKSNYSSAFAQLTWNVDSSFSVNSGLRWQHERKFMRLNNTVNDPAPSIISLILTPESVNGEDQLNSESVSWSLTPQYRWSDFFNFYATLSRGFKAGGFNTGFGNVPIERRRFDDETITHYEAGIKGVTKNNKSRWAFSVFQTEFKGFQDAAFIGSQYLVVNAERADLEGFELEGELAPLGNAVIDAQISYAKFVYGKNTHGQCHPSRLPDSPTDPAACVLSGEHPINTPLWKTHIGAYFTQPGIGFNFYERLDWSWTDKYNTSFSNDPLLTQSAYHWLDFRVGMRWQDCDIALWVNNALNEDVVDVAAVQNFYAGPGDGSVQVYLQDRRSYGLTVAFAFR